MGELVTVRRTWRRERGVRVGVVSCEAPLLHAVSSAPDQRLTGLRLAFDLTPRGRRGWPWQGRRTRIVAVFVRVRFDDRRATAVRLEAEGERPVSAEGLREHRFGWFFGDLGQDQDHDRDQDQDADLGARYVVNAVIETPGELTTITGAVRVDASIARGRLRRRIDHATMRDPVPLDLSTAGIHPAPAVRLCAAADIERSSRFRGPEAAAVQERFVQVMAEARQRAGIDPAQVGLQRSGDGQAAVFPPAIDESRVIPLLVEGLADALAQANAARGTKDRIRIRIALDRGHIAWGANGWVGDPPIAVQRLLDSDAAHHALSDNHGSDFALIVSDVLYRDVIAQDYGPLPSGAFRVVHVDIPAKNFAQVAWVYVPPGADQEPSAP